MTPPRPELVASGGGARTARPWAVAALVGAMLGAVVLAGLSYGEVFVPPARVVAALRSPAADPLAAQIVADIRLPRVVAAAAGGAALAVAGLLLQALFRNPLADVWSLGLTAGGQFGAALVVAAGGVAFASDVVGGLRVFANLSLVSGAAIGTAGVAAAMVSVAPRVGHVTLLVLGLMIGFLSQGLMSVVLHFANRSQGRIFASWNDGTFAAVPAGDLALLLVPTMAGAVAAVVAAKPLSTLLLGDTYAESVGVDVARLRRFVLAVVVLLAAPVTAFCGPVVFIGLIVPHFIRGAVRTAHLRPLLPSVALGGALLAVTADVVVHLPWRQHFLHLNAVLALLGAPAVMAIVLMGRRLRSDG